MATTQSPQWQLVQGMGNLTLQSPAPSTPSQAPSQAPSQQWQVLGQSQQGQWQMASPAQQQWQMPQAALSQWQMVNPMAYSPAPPGGPVYAAPGQCDVQRIRVGTTESKDERLGALIVTITEGSSYDPIFQQVEQTDDQGTSVATYRVALRGLERLVAQMEGSQAPPLRGDLEELLRNLQVVPNDKVVFNWECCSGCSERGFNNCHGCGSNETSLKLAKLALDRGYMVMFSDFSLKALISTWNCDYFGPKPFQQTGGCSGQMRLNFDPSKLKQCSSKQLAKVGELCEEGKAVIHAASNTIVYQLMPNAAQEAQRSGAYHLEVLTTATLPAGAAHPGYGAVFGGINTMGFSQPPSGDKSSMGHVLLTYPSGGRMLTSAGHWKELVHLGGVSEDALLRVAERYYGKEFSTNLGVQLQQCPDVGSRMQMQQAYAQQCVQSSAPY